MTGIPTPRAPLAHGSQPVPEPRHGTRHQNEDGAGRVDVLVLLRGGLVVAHVLRLAEARNEPEPGHDGLLEQEHPVRPGALAELLEQAAALLHKALGVQRHEDRAPERVRLVGVGQGERVVGNRDHLEPARLRFAVPAEQLRQNEIQVGRGYIANKQVVTIWKETAQRPLTVIPSKRR